PLICALSAFPRLFVTPYNNKSYNTKRLCFDAAIPRRTQEKRRQFDKPDFLCILMISIGGGASHLCHQNMKQQLQLRALGVSVCSRAGGKHCTKGSLLRGFGNRRCVRPYLEVYESETP
ncbi:MAG: hypothetical protein QGD94_03025, partial [Planctomycetia bacterium]|nr:hypothetical protein [Planctomycetia bacterium]